jgi:hypothetical protein
MSEETPKLLPCPFCGASDWTNHFAVTNGWLLTHERGCFLGGSTLFYLPGVEADRWNRRATPRPIIGPACSICGQPADWKQVYPRVNPEAPPLCHKHMIAAANKAATPGTTASGPALTGGNVQTGD